LFSFERKENNKHKPHGDTTILSKFTLLYAQLLSYLSLWRRYFLFWPLSRKEKIFLLCELCVSSEAGGEKHTLIYPPSKAGTISIAEGLRD